MGAQAGVYGVKTFTAVKYASGKRILASIQDFVRSPFSSKSGRT